MKNKTKTLKRSEKSNTLNCFIYLSNDKRYNLLANKSFNICTVPKSLQLITTRLLAGQLCDNKYTFFYLYIYIYIVEYKLFSDITTIMCNFKMFTLSIKMFTLQ